MPLSIGKALFMAGISSIGMAAMAQNRPAVLELFTSQGCSSCPPAEKLVGELAQRSDVLALTFHVDYWDDLGWRDRFSSVEATQRQREYAQRLKLSSVYTPQAIIDGHDNLVGSNRPAIEAALHGGRVGTPIALSVQQGRLRTEIGPQANAAASKVLVVAYLRSAVSSIGRGENAGRTIQESNVVRGFRVLGQWRGLPQHFDIPIDSLPADATDVAILVQTQSEGAIIGAAHIALR